MYLHVGNEVILNEKDIIGIFDLENASVSKFTKEFLGKSQKAQEVVNVTAEIPKSFVVWQKEGKRKLFLSQLAPATLRKRNLASGHFVSARLTNSHTVSKNP